MPYELTFQRPRDKGAKFQELAVVFGGEHDGEIVYCVEHKTGRLPSRIEMMGSGDPDGDPADTGPELCSRILLPSDSRFQLLPTDQPERRHVLYIAGPAGVGKSTFAAAYAKAWIQVRGGVQEQWLRAHGKWKDENLTQSVQIISEKKKDKALDDMFQKGGYPPAERIPLKSLGELYEQSMGDDDSSIIDVYKHKLLIIDDVDALRGRGAAAVSTVVDKLLKLGRATETDVEYVQHMLYNGDKSRVALGEATHFVVFPESTSAMQLERLLVTHLGKDPEDMGKVRLKSGDSRWIVLCKLPPYFMKEHELRLL